ncbi:hypothetical protein [Rhizobium deserti]|nr:hypothetical protein [Rhizobium deserti]
MTTILHPIRALRDSLQQIGAAVNASREYNRAGRTSDNQPLNPACASIPL